MRLDLLPCIVVLKPFPLQTRVGFIGTAFGFIVDHKRNKERSGKTHMDRDHLLDRRQSPAQASTQEEKYNVLDKYIMIHNVS